MRRLALLLAILLAISPGLSPAVGTRATGGATTLTVTSLRYPASYWTVGCIHLGYAGGGTSPRNYYQFRTLVDSLNAAWTASANNVEALVVNGDWTEDGIQIEPFRGDSLSSIYNSAKFRMLFNLGNHEALASDTLNGVSPYTTALLRFPELFNGKQWYSVDTDHFRLIMLNNNANYDVNDPSDYRVNNPFNLPEPDGLHGMDHAGIAFSNSNQRKFLTSALNDLGLRAPVLFGHRAIYGSNANAESRHNFISAATGSGYIRYFEQQLAAGRAAESNEADQHLKILTERMIDGALASASQGGVYHNQDISGFGLRTIDTTTVISAGSQGYKSYIGINPSTGNTARARTSTGIPEQWNTSNDPDLLKAWFATEHQYWGDYVLVKTYRVWTANSAGAPGYNGAGNLKLVDARYCPLDMRGRYTQVASTGDQSAPSQVTDIAGVVTGHTTATISWTAPGDDGNQGAATSYDLRYSTSVINSSNFASATAATGEPTPSVSGSPQTFALTGLTQGTTYYVAIKASDEVGNVAAISNVAQFQTTAPDVTPPAAVTNLAITLVDNAGVWDAVIGWTAPGDDGSHGTVASYTVRYSTSAITQGNFDAAFLVSSPPTPLVAGARQTMVKTDFFTEGATYYVALTASDEVPNVSAISNVVTLAVPFHSDTVAPAAISDLSVTARAGTSLTLGWTATGDDGSNGTASSYDVRWSTAPTVLSQAVPVVGNGTFTSADYPLASNYGQAIQAGGSYPPSSAFSLMNGQPQPEMHFILGGTNPVTPEYAACLSACAGATWQLHDLNNKYRYVANNRNLSDFHGGSFGLPLAPAVVSGNLVSRVFTNGTVYVNRSTTVTVDSPAGLLQPTGWLLDGSFDPDAEVRGQFPRQGGIYWGNLTVAAMDSLLTSPCFYDELALNDSNINGPTDGLPGIPVAPLDRIRALRARSSTVKLLMSINGFNIFVAGSPSVPSAYFPMQVRTFHKANLLGAWVYASDGVTPLEATFLGQRVRYVDITNASLRTWLADQVDSLAVACQLDGLFIDQLEASLVSERGAAPSTRWPTDAAWSAAWRDFLSRIQSNLPAPFYVSGEPAPQVAGSSESFALTGLQPRTRYWASVRAVDEVGNVSPASAVVHDTTTTQVVGTQQYIDFNTYCATNFSAAAEPLIHSTFGNTPALVPSGDWVYPSRNSASVAFETTLPCRGFIEYGLTTAYGSRTPDEDRPTFLHLSHLRGLSPGVTYHYRIVAADEYGSQVASADRTLTTGTFPGAILISAPGQICNVQGATYILTQDITSNTRGISIEANNVTVDLNGFTLTYDNGAPVGSGIQSQTSSSGVHFFKWNANTQGTLVRILNGKIVQGANNGSGGVALGTPFNPVCVYEGKVEVAGIDARWAGNDVDGLHNEYGILWAHHNVLRDGGTVTTNRSQGIKAIYAANLGSASLTTGVSHNLVMRGRHQGIMTKYGGSAPVADNEIYMDVYATNGYGIGAAQEIARNRIYGTGYHCVGVGFLVDTGAPGPIAEYVHDNFVFLQGEAPSLRDTEYGNDASVIGMRLSQYQCSTAPYTNYLYTGNTVIVKGRGGTLSVRGVQFSSSAYITNLNFTGNTVKCEIQDSSTRGACVTTQGNQTPYVQDSAGNPVYYTGNTFLSNDVFVRFGDQYSVGGNAQFRNNTFTKFGSLASYKPIRIGYLGNATVGVPPDQPVCGFVSAPQYWDSYNNRFIDSVLGSGVAFTSPSVEGTPGGRRDYSVGHSLYIRALGSGAVPLASRTVTVYDNVGLSYTVTTDALGYARVELIDNFYEATNNASSITATVRSGWNLRTSGYQNYTLSGGELSTSNNSGAPVNIQFTP